jgi:hypothetical protein
MGLREWKRAREGHQLVHGPLRWMLMVTVGMIPRDAMSVDAREEWRMSGEWKRWREWGSGRHTPRVGEEEEEATEERVVQWRGWRREST